MSWKILHTSISTSINSYKTRALFQFYVQHLWASMCAANSLRLSLPNDTPPRSMSALLQLPHSAPKAILCSSLLFSLNGDGISSADQLVWQSFFDTSTFPIDLEIHTYIYLFRSGLLIWFALPSCNDYTVLHPYFTFSYTYVHMYIYISIIAEYYEYQSVVIQTTMLLQTIKEELN